MGTNKVKTSVELYQEICSKENPITSAYNKATLRENAYKELIKTILNELIHNNGWSKLLDVFACRWLEYFKNKKGGGILYTQIRELKLKAIKINKYPGGDYKKICNSTWDIIAVLEGLHILLTNDKEIDNYADYFKEHLFINRNTLSILMDTSPIFNISRPKTGEAYSDSSFCSVIKEIDDPLNSYINEQIEQQAKEGKQSLKTPINIAQNQPSTNMEEQLRVKNARLEAELEKAKKEQAEAEDERKKQAVLNEARRKKELEAMQKIAAEKAERDAQEKLHAEKAKLEAELEKARKEQAEAEEERKRQVALNEVRRKKELEAMQKIAAEKAERDAQEKLRIEKAKLEAELEKARKGQAEAEEERKRQATLHEIRRKKELEAMQKIAAEKAERDAQEKLHAEKAKLEAEIEKVKKEQAKAEEERKRQDALAKEKNAKELEAAKKKATEKAERDAQEKLHAEKAKVKAELEKAKKKQAEAEEEHKRQTELNEKLHTKKLEAVKKEAEEKTKAEIARIKQEEEKAKLARIKQEKEWWEEIDKHLKASNPELVELADRLHNIMGISNDVKTEGDEKYNWVKKNAEGISLLFEAKDFYAKASRGVSDETFKGNQKDIANIKKALLPSEELSEAFNQFLEHMEGETKKLRDNGIEPTNSSISKTVTDDEFNKGWSLHETKQTTNTRNHRKIYEVVKNGITIDGELVVAPIVSIYVA